MRAIRILLAVIALGSALAFGQANAANNQLPTFPTEQAAKQHCPADVVVWLNTQSGVYHFKGQRWYANTKQGAFVCKKEADTGGTRATRNGQ